MCPKISQGVTTVIVGKYVLYGFFPLLILLFRCGISLAPFDISPFEKTKQPPPPLNLLGSYEYFRFLSSQSFVSEAADHPPTINFAFFVGRISYNCELL